MLHFYEASKVGDIIKVGIYFYTLPRDDSCISLTEGFADYKRLKADYICTSRDLYKTRAEW